MIKRNLKKFPKGSWGPFKRQPRVSEGSRESPEGAKVISGGVFGGSLGLPKPSQALFETRGCKMEPSGGVLGGFGGPKSRKL